MSEAAKKDTITEFHERWEFDRDVVDVFSDMLERSIPQYDRMRDLTFRLGASFTQHMQDSVVLDMGCSTGLSLDPFAKMSHRPPCIGFEISEPMLEASRRRFEGHRNVAIIDQDLRRLGRGVTLPVGWNNMIRFGSASLVLSILTLQFVPMEHRPYVLDFASWMLGNNGGALILVEKVIGETGKLDKLLVDNYHRHKEDQGYSKEQIERKALSLEGVLSPVTAKWNEEMLRNAGFRYVECFWRWLNFAGWIAVK